MKNALAASGRSLKEGWPMSSLNADRAIGLDSTKGSLKVGKDADLVIMDGDPLYYRTRVVRVLIDGNTVYKQ